MDNKTHDTILRCTLFVCITFAAIYFKDPDLLWWYFVPAVLM